MSAEVQYRDGVHEVKGNIIGQSHRGLVHDAMIGTSFTGDGHPEGVAD